MSPLRLWWLISAKSWLHSEPAQRDQAIRPGLPRRGGPHRDQDLDSKPRSQPVPHTAQCVRTISDSPNFEGT